MTKEDVQHFADGLEIGEKIPQCRQNWKILSTRKVEETELEQYPSGWSSEIQLTIKGGEIPSGQANDRSSRKESRLSETNFHGSIDIAG